MKKILLFLVLLILTVFGFIAAWFIFNQRHAKEFGDEIKINGNIIFIEIADNPRKIAKGLSGRASISQNQGMLFVFSEPGFYPFWMKNMDFALDFLWIYDKQIIQISENIKPEDFQPPETFISGRAFDMVLELNAGTAKRLNIKTGDRIESY